MHFSSSSTNPTSTNSFVFSFFQMADFRSGSTNSRPQPRWKWVFASEAFQFSNFAPRSSHDRKLHSISGPQLLELNLDPSSLEKCQNKIERRKKENFCRGSKKCEDIEGKEKRKRIWHNVERYLRQRHLFATSLVARAGALRKWGEGASFPSKFKFKLRVSRQLEGDLVPRRIPPST